MCKRLRIVANSLEENFNKQYHIAAQSAGKNMSKGGFY